MSDTLKQDLKALMEESRQRLMGALEGLQESELDTPVQSDGERWTVLQMLRHLQDAHRGMTGQVKRLLNGEETVPRDFDVDRWNARVQKKSAEASMTAEEALANLDASLNDLMSVIDHLKDEDWGRRGWQAGVKKEMSLEELLRTMGQHEALHAGEIAAARGKN
jgi:hypothetical protein